MYPCPSVPEVRPWPAWPAWLPASARSGGLPSTGVPLTAASSCSQGQSCVPMQAASNPGSTVTGQQVKSRTPSRGQAQNRGSYRLAIGPRIGSKRVGLLPIDTQLDDGLC
jgi:hypothetical protein